MRLDSSKPTIEGDRDGSLHGKDAEAPGRGDAPRLACIRGITSDAKSWEIGVSVHGGLDSEGEERFEIVARDIASGAKLEIGCVRKAEGRIVFESAGGIDFSRGGDWHTWASSLEAKDEVA